MRVAVSYDKFGTSKSGGARESLLTLLNGVSRSRGFVADIYQPPPVDAPPETEFEYEIQTEDIIHIPKFTWINQVATRSQWKRYLEKNISSEHDLLFTQNELAPASVLVAEQKGVPSLFFVRSIALTGYQKYSPKKGHLSNLLDTDFGGRIQYPFLQRNFHDYSQASKNATRTIANSQFTAKKMNELFGTEPNVIYPPIKLDNYQTKSSDGEYITMVNPRTEYKGADIFLNIAEELKDEKFLLVGPIGSSKIKDKSESLGNVTHWEWCDDMREAYSESKVVVTPSRFEEPFGRVPAEAMVSGIPCIVSDRGGLPEVVGKTGEIVDEVESVNAWISAIEDALENHNPDAQKERVKKFSAEKQVEKLNEIIDEVL